MRSRHLHRSLDSPSDESFESLGAQPTDRLTWPDRDRLALYKGTQRLPAAERTQVMPPMDGPLKRPLFSVEAFWIGRLLGAGEYDFIEAVTGQRSLVRSAVGAPSADLPSTGSPTPHLAAAHGIGRGMGTAQRRSAASRLISS